MDDHHLHDSSHQQQLAGRSPSLRRHNVSDMSVVHQMIGRKRCRCSGSDDVSSSSIQSAQIRHDDNDPRHHFFLSSMATRKRAAAPSSSAEDTYARHLFLLQQYPYLQQQVKRARYEQNPVVAVQPAPPTPSATMELENRPPPLKAQRRSLLTQQQQRDHFAHLLHSSPFFHASVGDERFEDECAATTSINSHQRRTGTVPTVEAMQHQHMLPEHERTMASHLAWNAVAMRKSAEQKAFLPKGPSPLISLLSHSQHHARPPPPPSPLRPHSRGTGNISPAHSDSSTDESTSTCSSDDQNLFSGSQPISRSFRERENYEAMMDLAASISNPTRFTQSDLQQFLSYRYKPPPTCSSGVEPSCVICISQFKRRQHIRVLPCHHEFHSKCIAKWLTFNASCPICRRDSSNPTIAVKPTLGIKQEPC